MKRKRLRAALSASREAWGLPALMVAECAILEPGLIFDSFLHSTAREHPEIHGVGD
jgi:hypothetical protein